MAKVLLFDFLSRGFGHTSFNRCMAEVALGLKDVDQVSLFAESSHLDIFQKLLPDYMQNKVGCESISTIPTSQYSNFYTAWFASETARKLIEKKVKEHQANRVVVLGFTGMLLRQLRKLKLKADVQIDLLAHGNLSEILHSPGRNPLRRIQSMRAQILAPLPSGLRFVILEREISEALRDTWGVNPQDIKVVELPIVPDEALNESTSIRPLKGHVNLGFIGDPRPQKGFDQFLNAAVASKGTAFRFHAIGREVSEMPSVGLDALCTLPAKAPLARGDYLEAIRQVDLVCVPFLPEYRLIPSGSLIDAITQLKPLIYPDSQAFKRLTERFGQIGYSYAPTSTLTNGVSRLSEKQFVSDLPIFKANLLKMRNARLPAQLSLDF